MKRYSRIASLSKIQVVPSMMDWVWCRVTKKMVFAVVLAGSFLSSLMTLGSGVVYAHGDVVPQAVDTTGLAPLGEQWLSENPYRSDEAQKPVAIEIGTSAYNQNCARCHGLEAISGGIAPDLRLLKGGIDDDEWFIERVRNGYHQNGVTKMPGFETLMNQEAMWAIRTYVESQPLP